MRHPRPREIRDLREEMALTRAELAARLLTTARTIEAYEQGLRRMPPLMWEAMQLMHASPAYARLVERHRKLATADAGGQAGVRSRHWMPDE